MGTAAALIGAGGSLLSGVLGGKGASSAAKMQAQAAQQGIAAQQAQFAQTQQNEAPFLSAGTGAVEQIRRLLGLGDSNTGVSVDGNPAYSAADQQAGALSNLTQSPLFTSRYNTGLDAILQSASATGGLRGGNTQNSLAQFGSGLFADVLQNQLSNLGGLVGTGANAASGLASAGQNNANAVSNLFTQQGAANASGALGQATAATGTINDLSKILQRVTGGAGNGGGW